MSVLADNEAKDDVTLAPSLLPTSTADRKTSKNSTESSEEKIHTLAPMKIQRPLLMHLAFQ